MVLVQKLQGDTVHLKAEMRDVDLITLIDVVSHQITIQDAQGNTVDVLDSPVHDATGKYHQDYFVPLYANVGIWFVFWQAAFSDGQTRRNDVSFEVVAE